MFGLKNELLTSLAEAKIIAIIRGIPAGTGEATARALVDGGVSFLEITLNTEGAVQMIADLKAEFGDKLRIGAGTVLDVEQAKEAIKAGAEYIISPNLDEEVLAYGLENGIEVWPGTMTPTEMVRAHKLGAQAIKVFPIGSLGVKFIKEVRAPLGHIPMVATGGINQGNIQEVLGIGATAVGLGGNLVDNQLILKGEFEKITELAKGYVRLAKEVDVHVTK
jgi:2-dehydro-3-deoxyphosphogluconate aldolase/(4S)-4-hydroxy-2-oxoglutarate aldolase